uniref:DUF4283 domain-containing protein n=1 Tax=Tanacetum cinerariifolium TaxID=118510 RepID=A0A6L2JKF7_TANCI|nr:hypothetical protein [Tanacetum cinerariifolium]
MTNKIYIVLKAITNRLAGSLPSDIAKNPKLNTFMVLSAHSYPIIDPQCSSHPFTLINAVKTCSKEASHSHTSQLQTEMEIETQQTEEPKPTIEDEFQDLHLSLPVLEVLAHALIYNTMLDKYVESLELGKNGSAFIQGEIPAKIEDPRLFTIPCRLGDLRPLGTLVDLGSCVNIIPLYLFRKLNIRLLEETDHIFGLDDGTKSYPVGIVKDIEVHIEELKLLNDFYVIDMKKDPETPLLAGRGFLAAANAVIDCKKPKWRESYKPRPSSDGIGAQTPYFARKDFLDDHLSGEWEIARDAEINPFKDVLLFRRMNKPPKNGDEAWHAKIILIHPNEEEFTKTLQSIPTTRTLSERESPREIINLDHFYDTWREKDVNKNKVNKGKSKQECLVQADSECLGQDENECLDKNVDQNSASNGKVESKMESRKDVGDCRSVDGIGKASIVKNYDPIRAYSLCDSVSTLMFVNQCKNNLKCDNKQYGTTNMKYNMNKSNKSVNDEKSSGNESKNNFVRVVNNLNELYSNKLDFMLPDIDEDGVNIVKYEDELVKEGCKKWVNTVCCYFVGTRMALVEVKYNVRRMWIRYKLDKIVMNGHGFYFFKFKNEEGMQYVVKNGHWIIHNKPYKNGTLMLTLKKGPNSFANMGQISEHSYGSMDSKRVLMEVNDVQGCKDSIVTQYYDVNKVKLQSKAMFTEYPWNPNVYKHCKVFGHSLLNCQKRPRSEAEIKLKSKEKVDAVDKEKTVAEPVKDNEKNQIAKENGTKTYNNGKVNSEGMKKKDNGSGKVWSLSLKNKEALKKSTNKYVVLKDEDDNEYVNEFPILISPQKKQIVEKFVSNK